MALDALRQIAVEQTDKPFGRIALQIALSATLANNALAAGSLALTATRYRKLKRGADNADIVDVCGHDDAQSGLALVMGDNAAGDDLMQALARRCRNYLGSGSASVTLQVSWRRKAGDITGLFHMEVTLAGQAPATVATADTEADAAANPAFADLVNSIFNTIKNRTDALGW